MECFHWQFPMKMLATASSWALKRLSFLQLAMGIEHAVSLQHSQSVFISERNLTSHGTTLQGPYLRVRRISVIAGRPGVLQLFQKCYSPLIRKHIDVETMLMSNMLPQKAWNASLRHKVLSFNVEVQFAQCTTALPEKQCLLLQMRWNSPMTEGQNSSPV